MTKRKLAYFEDRPKGVLTARRHFQTDRFGNLIRLASYRAFNYNYDCILRVKLRLNLSLCSNYRAT